MRGLGFYRESATRVKAALTKTLAELWQGTTEIRGFTLEARLWGDLAKLLESGATARNSGRR